MAKVIRQLLRNTLYKGKGNLYCLDDPYQAITHVLRNQQVTGIVDAGASDGRVSKRLLEKFPGAQVYQFEPNPIYSDKLAALQSADPHYHPFAVALSDEPGELQLQRTASPGSVSMFKPNALMHDRYAAEAKVEDTFTVPVTTLDTWWNQQDRPPVQLMKFDIQAGELRALRGASQMLDESVLAIYSEVHLNPLYEGGAIYSEIDLLLRKHGFSLYNLYSARHDPQGTGMLLWAHALFIKREKLGF